MFFLFIENLLDSQTDFDSIGFEADETDFNWTWDYVVIIGESESKKRKCIKFQIKNITVAISYLKWQQSIYTIIFTTIFFFFHIYHSCFNSAIVSAK